MSPTIAAKMLDALSERDIALISSLERFRLLSSTQIRRLHFDPTHTRLLTATRSTQRVLGRLEAEGMVSRLQQRVGGHGGGSSSLIWQLGPTGEALLRQRAGGGKRRRYVEPSGMFTRHTLAVADIAIAVIEGTRAGRAELIRLDTEPACWRRYLTSTGIAAWVKPDLHVVTAQADFEDHAFIEVDLGTEHRPQLLAKARAFQRYRTTQTYQDAHGVFPLVIWAVPDQIRLAFLDKTLAADKTLDPGLFRVITLDQTPAALGVDIADPFSRATNDSQKGEPHQ